jgi:hypothetical protein
LILQAIWACAVLRPHSSAVLNILGGVFAGLGLPIPDQSKAASGAH